MSLRDREPRLIFSAVRYLRPILFEGAIVMEVGTVVLIVALDALFFGLGQW